MNSPQQIRRWRDILEALCADEAYEEFWEQQDGERRLNITMLAARISQQTGIQMTQSTLHRAYSGDTNSLGDKTVSTLSAFFDLPPAVIRGEVQSELLTEYGMDITLTEIRMLKELRGLNPAGQALVRQTIRTLRDMNPQPQQGLMDGTTGKQAVVTQLVPRSK